MGQACAYARTAFSLWLKIRNINAQGKKDWNCTPVRLRWCEYPALFESSVVYTRSQAANPTTPNNNPRDRQGSLCNADLLFLLDHLEDVWTDVYSPSAPPWSSRGCLDGCRTCRREGAVQGAAGPADQQEETTNFAHPANIAEHQKKIDHQSALVFLLRWSIF